MGGKKSINPNGQDKMWNLETWNTRGLSCRIQEDKTQKKTNMAKLSGMRAAAWLCDCSRRTSVSFSGDSWVWKVPVQTETHFSFRERGSAWGWQCRGRWGTLTLCHAPGVSLFSLCLGQLWGARKMGGQNWGPHTKNRGSSPRQCVQENTVKWRVKASAKMGRGKGQGVIKGSCCLGTSLGTRRSHGSTLDLGNVSWV